MPVPKRRQNANRGVLAGEYVDQRDTHFERFAGCLTGDTHQTADRLHDEVVAGQVRAPAVPKPEIEQKTTPGLAARTCSYASPNRRSVPGRKFSTTTSARRASSRAAARSAARSRSRMMLRLERFTLSK